MVLVPLALALAPPQAASPLPAPVAAPAEILRTTPNQAGRMTVAGDIGAQIVRVGALAIDFDRHQGLFDVKS